MKVEGGAGDDPKKARFPAFSLNPHHSTLNFLMKIHPTAIIADGAKLAADVEVGPYSIIGPDVEVAAGCVIGAHVILENRIVIGDGTKVGHGTSLGANPQDL